MIVGIAGRKRSGKNTVASYLEAKYDYKQTSFAHPIKQMACIAFGWDISIFEDEVLKEQIDPFYGISPRQIAQNIGTEWAQKLLPAVYPEFEKETGRTLWVKRLFKDYQGQNISISDVRFPDTEVSEIGKRGGYIIKMIGRGDETDDHPSEKEADRIMGDFIVDNSGSRDQLFRKIDTIMSFIILKGLDNNSDS